MTSETPIFQNIDIEAYILNEYIPAKPLDVNLEVHFSDSELASTEACAQLRCGDVLKFPFVRPGHQPRAVAIRKSEVLVSEDAATETKRVVELTLESPDLFEFQPGDTIAVLPSNDGKLVDKLLDRLDLMSKADTMCNVKLALICAKKGAKVPAHIPQTTSPREILTHCLALNAVPQKQFLSGLAGFTENKKERSFLACLSSKQAASSYSELVLERGFCFLNILEICASCRPSLAFLVEHLPRLLPRPYSLSNSPLATGPQELQIIYSILSQNPGVTTSMMESKAHKIDKGEPAEIVVYPRLSNNFRYTEDLSSNQILIAVGTGVAPFLGFLSHKEQLLNQQSQRDIGKTWLYLGAKTTRATLNLDQLLVWQLTSVLQRLRMCQSRGESPCYVQQLLEEDSEELVPLLLEANTVLYVCADGAKISQSIASGLIKCLQTALHLSEEEAAQKLKELRAQGKYREDVWL
ncbi:methionine synthase reductase [Drosophila bipectinata]|uniref:methionine synthase reductase n=1 Tax=Drosophila bipectinata TaxID=42026 RepID=UPI001C892F7B|nr:methionine synthase reductase [Drosophila bipectinata]